MELFKPLLLLMTPALLAPCAYAQEIKGEMKEDKLYEAGTEFLKEGLGLDPMAKWSELVEESITPEEVGDLQDYLDKMKDCVKTAEQVSSGELTPAALNLLKNSYNKLKESKKVPRKLRQQLPGLDQVDKLLATMEFAMKMREAAKANKVAVQAQSLFDAFANDAELGGPDEPLATGLDSARRVYEKYWRGGTQVQMEDIMRHQGLLSMRQREGDTPADKAAYEDNVVAGIAGLLKMGAEFKEASRAQWRAQREVQELAAAYERWGHVTGEDMEQLKSLLGIEKETETLLPALEKLPAEAAAAMAQARTAFRAALNQKEGEAADKQKAYNFCSEMPARLYSARLRLRDFGQKSQKVAKRTRPLYERMLPVEKDATAFCYEVSAADKKREAEDQQKAEEEYQKRMAGAKQGVCSYSGITGARYSGPLQRDVDALLTELDNVLGGRDGFAEEPPYFDFSQLQGKGHVSVREQVRDGGAMVSETEDLDPDGLKASDYAKLESQLTSKGGVAGIYRKVLDLHREYTEASEAFFTSLKKARAAADKEHSDQLEKCLSRGKDDKAACAVCDINPASAAFTKKYGEAPQLNFEVIGQKTAKWSRLHEQALAILNKGDGGLYEVLLRVKPAGHAYSCDVSKEQLEERYNDTSVGLGAFRSNQSLYTAHNGLRGMRDNWSNWHSGLNASYNHMKRDAPRLAAAENTKQQQARKALQALSAKAPEVTGAMTAAAAYLDKTPWLDGQGLRTKAAELQELLRRKEQELQDWNKEDSEALQLFTACPSLLGEIESYAASFGAAADKLEKIEKTLQEDTRLRQVELMADGTNPRKKYITGADAARLASAQAKLREMSAQNQGVLKRAAPFLEAKLKGMLAVAAALTPVPADAILVDDGSAQTLLQASVYQELEKKARAASSRGADPRAEGELIKLEAEVEAVRHFEEFEKTEYAGHPVYKSYLAALAACRAGQQSADEAQSAEKGRLRKEHASVMQALEAAVKNPQASGGIAALRQRADKLIKDIYALSGKDAQDLGVSETDVQQKLADTERALEEKKQEAADAKALEAVKAVEKRAQALPKTAAAVAELDKLMAEAAKLAQDAGIDGRMEVREIMDALAEKRNAFPSVKPSAALAAVSPAQAAADEENQSALENAMDDLRAEEQALAALPGGPASEQAVSDLVEKARGIAENANSQFPKGPNGTPHPNKRLIDDAFARLTKTASLKKAGVKTAGPAAPGLPPRPGAADPGADAVRSLYQKFAQAYSSKDLAGVLDLLTEDWESSEGISLDDMERTLTNSFAAFDSVKMEIQNLQIVPTGGGYLAKYNTLLTGNIRQNDIKHEEKSFQMDTVIITPQGARIAKTSGNTAWVR